ncbi:uncharacterized protein EV422DRAFT_193305 [Fimicolochytrium jonesii]|uniref:uncharacterized protein n=1 Tax=Fimicolochytrium jonesii TaxID=1396493 RepID=UPI0022FDB282|nr:uncharacterized protein EV422DRAFT_193305 [Fimicolochytrium jonesii]KAI8818176.1 hypothetical protein EV422DRAFT_193305 [Fimicolochytrium jonesii]
MLFSVLWAGDVYWSFPTTLHLEPLSHLRAVEQRRIRFSAKSQSIWLALARFVIENVVVQRIGSRSGRAKQTPFARWPGLLSAHNDHILALQDKFATEKSAKMDVLLKEMAVLKQQHDAEKAEWQTKAARMRFKLAISSCRALLERLAREVDDRHSKGGARPPSCLGVNLGTTTQKLNHLLA